MGVIISKEELEKKRKELSQKLERLHVIKEDWMQYEEIAKNNHVSYTLFKARMERYPDLTGKEAAEWPSSILKYEEYCSQKKEQESTCDSYDKVSAISENQDNEEKPGNTLFEKIPPEEFTQMELEKSISLKTFRKRYYDQGLSFETASMKQVGQSTGDKYAGNVLTRALRKFSRDPDYMIVANVSMGTIIKDYAKSHNLKNDVDEICKQISDYVYDTAGIYFSADEIRRSRYNYIVLYKDKPVAFINYDEEQFFIVKKMHPTLSSYQKSRRKDKLKVHMSEFLNIPFLQVKYNQIGCGDMIFADFYSHLNDEKYIYQHTYNNPAEYYREKEELELQAYEKYKAA